MKTKCPNCKAKFNSPDEGEGKEVKCPKCAVPFVITPLAEKVTVTVEVCTSCGKRIGKLEQACLFEGNIVCAQCDSKLRLESNEPIEQVVNLSDATFEQLRKGNIQATAEVSIGGIIVAVIFVFIAFLPMINDAMVPPDRSTRMYNPEIEKFSNISIFLICLGVAITLFIRSLLGRFGFWRGVLTVLGSYIAFAVITLAGFMLIKHGMPSDYSVLVGMLIWLLPAAILLKYGFKPKRGFRKKTK